MEILFSKEINEWINSGEYLVNIDEMRTRIMKQSTMSNSESTTASIFENELYYLIKFRTGIELNIVKEQNVDGINHTFGELKSRTSGSGRLDAVVNNLIIEYKHCSKLSSDKEQNIAIQQVKDYLKALNSKKSIKYNAILTDGIRICYFSFLENEVQNTNILPRNNKFWEDIVQIVKCIDQYSAFSLNVYYEPIDIFKDLYMSIIPKSIRHSMGEYFTPKWLADYVITNGIADLENQEEWKAIDPCCGSGIFLLELIKKIVGKRNIKLMTNKEKSQLKEKILSRVYGIV